MYYHEYLLKVCLVLIYLQVQYKQPWDTAERSSISALPLLELSHAVPNPSNQNTANQSLGIFSNWAANEGNPSILCVPGSGFSFVNSISRYQTWAWVKAQRQEDLTSADFGQAHRYLYVVNAMLCKDVQARPKWAAARTGGRYWSPVYLLISLDEKLLILTWAESSGFPPDVS